LEKTVSTEQTEINSDIIVDTNSRLGNINHYNKEIMFTYKLYLPKLIDNAPVEHLFTSNNMWLYEYTDTSNMSMKRVYFSSYSKSGDRYVLTVKLANKLSNLL